ncbi:MAG: hypothetical protein AAGG55_11290 [Pseudomonadota bacterium]
MDQAENSQTSVVPEAEANGGRMTLLLIAGTPVIVLLASSWLWFYVASGRLDIVGALGTSNAGELVQPPRQAADAGWISADGAAFAPATPPRWSLVIPQQTLTCGEACESRLYEVRQIHQSLGKELGRVQRLLVINGDPAGMTLNIAMLSDDRPMPDDFAKYLATEQRGMQVYGAGDNEFGAMFPDLQEHPASWYLMDPSGWVMMRYDPTVNYKDVISDLKFLIKNSNG